ncbi:MAG TPA: S-methyl-5-thioribose-1-phosphate isomerase [Bacteroidota bacterium]|nr:S-methyl-5-thioribose-1-phosphate isomerase [Bacteroidota bacterium]
MLKTIEWLDDRVRFIDQTQLPSHETYTETSDYRIIAEAIRSLSLRGAPLIGVAAAYGVALASLAYRGNSEAAFKSELQKAIAELGGTRPTAVNLFYALRRMQQCLDQSASGIADTQRKLIDEALKIHVEDQEMCRNIGRHGSELVPARATVLTHCNAGALATGGDGTALNVIATAAKNGKSVKVFVDETRPLFQGSRLTMWELMRQKIDATLITDSTAPSLMQKGLIDLVVVGADRIASNGDTANKIGSYGLAVAAQYHNIPFYVAAPLSTIDASLSSGSEIPIEERAPEEISQTGGQRIAPHGAKVFAPAFDVIPASLISAIITESGVHTPPYSFS